MKRSTAELYFAGGICKVVFKLLQIIEEPSFSSNMRGFQMSKFLVWSTMPIPAWFPVLFMIMANLPDHNLLGLIPDFVTDFRFSRLVSGACWFYKYTLNRGRHGWNPWDFVLCILSSIANKIAEPNAGLLLQRFLCISSLQYVISFSMCMYFLLNFPLCFLSYLERVCNSSKFIHVYAVDIVSDIHKPFQPNLMQNSSFWWSMLMDCHSFLFITRPTKFWL